MNKEVKEILNNADSSTKFKMVEEDGTEKEMNIAGLIEQLLNDNKNLLDCMTNLQDYKSRCEKAIEYIKKNINYYYDEDLEDSIYQDEVSGNELLKILGGNE